MSGQNNELLKFSVSGSMDKLLHECGFSTSQAVETSNINELSNLSEKIDMASNILKLSTLVLEANIPKSMLDRTRIAKQSISAASLLTLTEYSKLSNKKILDIINNCSTISNELWSRYSKDPDKITSSLLNDFYNECGNYNLFFERYYSSMVISLGTALRGYIALVAKDIGGKFFDFGGGIGNLSSTVSNLGHKDVYIVETDNKELDFVKWRDKKCGNKNVNYIGSKEIDNFFENNKESFTFGASIEVMEHVLNPPELLEKISGLIAPGGYLFLTSSFHIYPHPGHLKSNVKYTNKEDEILKPYGLERVEFEDVPIPFLFNWKMFQKKT